MDRATRADRRVNGSLLPIFTPPSLTFDLFAFRRTLSGAHQTLEVVVDQTVVVQDLVDVHVVVLGGVFFRRRRRSGRWYDSQRDGDGDGQEQVVVVHVFGRIA